MLNLAESRNIWEFVSKLKNKKTNKKTTESIENLTRLTHGKNDKKEVLEWFSGFTI